MAVYTCSRCSSTRQQGWQELMQVWLWPKSLHATTFVSEEVLQWIRLQQRHCPGISWQGLATTITEMGLATFNQVGPV
jgi:hypothetical protein